MPDGITTVTVQAWGGGGGGDGGSNQSTGGGGGGAYASSVVTVVPNTGYTVTVGGGGAGGTNALGGGTGGNSIFGANVVVAAGGSKSSGATGGAGGSAAASTGTTKFSGGAGASAVSNTGGGGGGSATSTAVGGSGATTTGGTGQGAGGGGGGNGANGSAGTSPGGGGGGKGNGASTISGAGAPGRVIVSYTANDAPVVNGLSSSQNYHEGVTGALTVAPGAVVTDADSPNFDGGSLQVEITSNKSLTEDRLGIANLNNITLLDARYSVNNVMFGTLSVRHSGIEIGSILPAGDGWGGNALKVTFNANATPARVQDLLRSVTYLNTDADNASANTRTLTITLLGGGGPPVTATTNVVVIAAPFAITMPSSAWTPLLLGSTFDPSEDQQATSGPDLTGSSTTPLLYGKYDDKGTASITDDIVAFRVRVDDSLTNTGLYNGYVFLGLDLELDGDVDLFIALEGTSKGTNLFVYSTNTASISPSTTSLVNRAIVPGHNTLLDSNYRPVDTVEGSTQLAANSYTGSDGERDYFMSFQFTFTNLANVLNTMPINNFINTGNGYATVGQILNSDLRSGMTEVTPLRFVLATATQSNSLNSDFGGVGRLSRIEQGLTWGDLGAISKTISFGNAPPEITSGANDTATYYVPEGAAAVGTVTTQDPNNDTVSYSLLTGGAYGIDGSLFRIHPATGALIFITPPDYEAPADANADNVYLVTVQASDGKGGIDTQLVSVYVTDVWELVTGAAPIITSNGGGSAAAVVVAENAFSVTTVTASDDGDTAGGVKVTANLSYAVVGGADAAAFTIGSGSGVLTFTSAPDFETKSSYTVTVGVTDSNGLSDQQTLTVTVTNVSEAPVLTAAGPNFTTIDEDAVNNSGATVAQILGSPSNASDQDAGTVIGMAVTSLTSGNGTWQYSVDGGTYWATVGNEIVYQTLEDDSGVVTIEPTEVSRGAISATNALLLRSEDRIRFRPNSQNATTANFTFVAWDETSGVFGGYVDASVGGGTTAFSTASDTAGITVTAVNDAPTVAGGPVILTGTSDYQNSTNTTIAAILASLGVTAGDVDNGAVGGAAITAIAGTGTWQYSVDATTWLAVGTVAGDSALLLLPSHSVRYVPAYPGPVGGETAQLSLRAWDQTGATSGAEGTHVDATIGGGTTPFSSGTLSATLSVTQDTRALAVTNVSVNEASNYAVFAATGVEGQKTVLNISNTSTTGLTQIEYFNGSAWVSYISGTYLTVPASKTIVVRVSLAPEQDAAHDGPETFTLVAATTAGTLSTGGVGTIKDDGTGAVFLAGNNTSTPNTSADAGYPAIDDDRPLTVGGATVNEASPYALFTVGGAAGQYAKLTLGVDADSGTLNATIAGFTLEYFNGTAWVAYVADAFVPIPAGGTLLVRTGIASEHDSAYEGAELFTLTAATTSGTSGVGIGTIKDDGTGGVFLAGNNTSTPNTSADAGYPAIDDDRSEIVVLDGTGNDLVDGNATVFVGTASECYNSSITLTISNIGSAPLVLTSYTLTSGDAARFYVPALATPVSLNPTQSTTLTVSFSATVEGSFSATLQIASNDGNESPFDILLTGTGVDPFFDEVLARGVPAWTASSYTAADHLFQAVLGFAPGADEVIDVVNNTGSDPVRGTFNGVPQAGVVELSYNGAIYYFKIDYEGGDGNDITLTRIEPLGPPMWTWRAGSSARNVKGNYGGAGVPNPGSRQGAMNFMGADGDLWVFGGYGYATSNTTPRWLSDLWRYSPSTGTWTFVKGSAMHNAAGVYGTRNVPAAGNMPGARHTGVTWVDCNGKFWLFGGVGPTGRLNDLWRYDPVSGNWCWMAGSDLPENAGTYGTRGVPSVNNIPRARQGAVAWSTGCSLFLFGGSTDGTASFLNDLWKFDIYTEEWTWISGAPGTLNHNGEFGTQGLGHADNVPSARRVAQGWVEQGSGGLWLFGGQGLGATGTAAGDLNDIWRYDITENKWQWIRGSSSINPPCVYGTQARKHAQNEPPGRGSGGTWVAADGRLWLYGGMQNFNSFLLLQDLWVFDPSDSSWTWTMGSANIFQSGKYGTVNQRASDNLPGARFTPSIWRSPSGAVWCFGGGGVDRAGTGGRLSDVWSFDLEMPADVAPEAAPNVAPFDDSSYIVNSSPSASDRSEATSMFIPIAGTLNASDPDGDLTRFLPVGGTVTAAGTLVLQENGQWLFTPAPGFVGTGSFTFQAVDSYGGASPVRNIKVTVINSFADSDGDGLDDEFERRTWGDLAAGDPLGDSDGDGQANYMEFMAGTDPLDGASRLNSGLALTPGASSSGSFRFEISHVRPGVSYHLESSTDLLIWQRIGTFTFPSAGAAIIEDPDTPDGTRFYRMNLQWQGGQPVP